MRDRVEKGQKVRMMGSKGETIQVIFNNRETDWGQVSTAVSEEIGEPIGRTMPQREKMWW